MPRPGFALPVSLLLVAVLLMAGAGMLALAARESEIAGAMARRAAARAAAESGVRWALASWSTRRYRELEPGETTAPASLSVAPGLTTTATVTRLGAALYLVRATGQQSAGRTSAIGAAGALVRTIDPDSLLDAFPAAIVADAEAWIESGAVAVGEGPCRRPGARAGVMAPRVTVGPAAAVEGAPPVLLAEPPPLPMPDLFLPPRLDALVTLTVDSPFVRPAPGPGQDGCRGGGSSWGAVSAVSPGRDPIPFVRSGADLTVRGGQGRAFLLVEGDLVLEDMRFHGVALVRGRLTVGPGTTIRGAVRAATVHVRDGSIAYDACEVLAAVTAGGLDRAYRPRHRLWIPVFESAPTPWRP